MHSKPRLDCPKSSPTSLWVVSGRRRSKLSSQAIEPLTPAFVRAKRSPKWRMPRTQRDSDRGDGGQIREPPLRRRARGMVLLIPPVFGPMGDHLRAFNDLNAKLNRWDIWPYLLEADSSAVSHFRRANRSRRISHPASSWRQPTIQPGSPLSRISAPKYRAQPIRETIPARRARRKTRSDGAFPRR